MAGNFKMHKTPGDIDAFFEKFLPLVERSDRCDVVLRPPFTSLEAASRAARASRVEIGAQNVHWAKEGAFTGEVSAPMLIAAGCTHVIVGHSERRQYFGETDEAVRKRAAAAVDAGLTAIVCVGERLEDREAARTEAVLERQFQEGLAALAPEQFARVVIAYEPVWAIGTGRTATPEMAAGAHRLIRALAAGAFGEESARALRILYGGSVKPDNIQRLMAQPEIDGALVGGACLEAESFAAIVNF